MKEWKEYKKERRNEIKMDLHKNRDIQKYYSSTKVSVKLDTLQAI